MAGKQGNRNVAQAGFALFLLVEIVSFHSATVFAGNAAFHFETASTYLTVLVVARIVGYGVMALVTVRLLQMPFGRMPFALVCTAISCLGFAFVEYSAPANQSIMFLLGSCLFGVSQGAIGLGWLSLLREFDYRKSYLYIILSHVAATLLCAAVLLLPLSALAPFTVLCILAGNVLYGFTSRNTSVEHTVQSQFRGIAPRLGKGVAAVCAFAFISGFMVVVTNMTTPEVDPVVEQYTVLSISGVVLAVMIIPALAYKQPLQIENSYKVALPLSALGFLILPGLIDAIPPFVAGTLTTTGYMLTGIVLACTVAEVARVARVQAFPLFAGTEMITLVFLLVGILMGSLFINHISSLDFALLGVGCLYLLVLGISWLFSHETKNVRNSRRSDALRFAGDPQDMNHVLQADVLERPFYTFGEIVEKHKLSDQEQQVLLQLLEGRTTPRIAQELYISASSVKYYTQKIYRAFGVHARSELLEKVDLMQQGDERL